MYELLDLLGRLPRPVKTLGTVFLLMPLAYVLTRAAGFADKFWMVGLGMTVIAVSWWAFDEFVRRGDRKKGDAFAGELRKEGEKGGASKQEVREALRELSTKWNDSVQQLQKTGLSIYSLPWYLLIGEPQSGKSTTLKNSGLDFPVGNEGLSGTGGTRNCDWWFTNEAVILDTAGRFTFQEENAPDSSEWSTFLKLLKRFRKYCPVNGVLVVVPATSLLEDTPEEQDRKAANIRSKLIHLQRVLEIRFPVFIMFTKADRILGFSEFFSKLDPVDQKQLVGWSNPSGPEKAYDVKGFDAVFDDFLTRMHKLRLKFTANEEIVQNVDRIFVFPEELRALRDPIKRYFQGVFVETRYDEPFSFRGFYLSSGVQQGKPIARATRELLGGASEGVVENLEQIFKKSRAFFIKDFYERKVFPEQGLIARTRAAEKRERGVKMAVWGGVAFMTLLFVFGLIFPWLSLRRHLLPIKQATKRAEECVTGKKPCSVLEAHQIAEEIYTAQVRIQKKSLLFLMFFRGAKSSELVDLMTRINRKLYVDKVVVPVLADASARMGALNWETGPDYRKEFFPALDCQLKWVAAKANVPGDQPLVKPDELKLAPAAPLVLATKGQPWTQRSAEVDAWAQQVGGGNVPDLIVNSVIREKADLEKVAVPKADDPVRKFEEYWTVANLLRWDFKLVTLLNLYVAKYQALLATASDQDSHSLLARSAGTGKEFKTVYDQVTKHLGVPRVKALDFPGLTPAEWERFFNQDYGQLMRYNPAVPSLVNERNRTAIVERMRADYTSLVNQTNLYAFLVMDDPAKKGFKAWTPPAAAISPMLVQVSDFSDMPAFEATEKPKQVVDDASTKSSSMDRKNAIDAFNAKQKGLRDAAVANKGVQVPPDQVGDNQFRKAQLDTFVDQVPTVALVYRTIPYTREFLDKQIGPGCVGCYNKTHADAMISAGCNAISEVEKVRSRADIRSQADPLGNVMFDYLARYIDQYQPRAPRPTGGGGFYVPVKAVREANSWREFQGIIQRWSPKEGGGGGDAPPPQPTDVAGALSQSDVETFAGRNTTYLGQKLIDYFNRKRQASRPSAPAKAPQVDTALVSAVNLFRDNVIPLPDQPLDAWRSLVNGRTPDGQTKVSLRGYHAFSRNPAVKRDRTYGPDLIFVEKRGANLVRDAIRPQFEAALEKSKVDRRLRELTGQFPFISEAMLRQDRVRYASGEMFKQGGSGNRVTYRIDVPTINQTHFSGILTDVGALADEFALDPILFYGERDFNFVNEPPQSLLAVGRGWQVFLFGGAGSRGSSVIKEHKVEIKPLQFTPSQGKRFMGERVNSLFLFDRNVVVRPSTDFKTGRSPNPFLWRLGSADAPVSITGRDEESTQGWTGELEIYGGPLRFWYFVRLASEDRDRREFGDDPEKDRDREKVWTIRVQIPNAQNRAEPLEGLFEVALDEPMPPILPR